MRLYKLTDQNNQTRNNTQWGENVTHTAKGGELCSSDVLHSYSDPRLAILFNPIYGNVLNPNLWECEGDVFVMDGMKNGGKSLTTIKQIPIPEITTEQRIKFAIICAAQVPQSIEWLLWAKNWYDCSDRSTKAAEAAESAARAARATWAAWVAEAAARAAARAARAAEAAEAAARTARTARAAVQATCAARAAARASWAAEAAESATRAAEAANKKINFVQLIDLVMTENKEH